jgi:predicted enzyme related to lactoylglutathione lyase
MKPLFENVDCVSFFVDDLDRGIAFYAGSLGLRVLWRAQASCGLGLEEGVTEVVLVNQHNPTANFKVESVLDALEAFQNAGGTLEYGPFDIDIGKCAVVSDLWGNRYCILDMSKGRYVVDEKGDVTGVKPD